MADQTQLYHSGSLTDGWRLFGAHPATEGDVHGWWFNVWAPHAKAVSVVGDFNGWDGRVNPMRRIDYTDIFELFIPGDLANTRYKFEALYRDGNVDIFADPYAVAYEVAPGNASILTDSSADCFYCCIFDSFLGT